MTDTTKLQDKLQKQMLIASQTYYNDLLQEILNNEKLKEKLVNAKDNDQILLLTSISIAGELMWLELGINPMKYSYNQNNGLNSLKNNMKSALSVYQGYLGDYLIKNNIIVYNCISKNLPEYELYTDTKVCTGNWHEEKKNAEDLCDIYRTIKSKYVKTVMLEVIARSYLKLFNKKSLSANQNKADCFNVAYESLNKNKDILQDIWSYENQDIAKFNLKNKEKSKLNYSIRLFEILNIYSNYNEYELIKKYIKEVSEIKKELLEKGVNKEVSDYVVLLKNTGLEKIYNYHNKEKNENETEIINILLPLLDKRRKSALSLLYGGFNRNEHLENKLNKKDNDKYEINLIIDQIKSSRMIDDFFSFSAPLNIEDKIYLKINKIKNKTYAICISLNKSEVPALSGEDEEVLASNYRELLFTYIDKVLIDKMSTNKIEFYKEIMEVFLKEGRALNLNKELNKKQKTSSSKLKI